VSLSGWVHPEWLAEVAGGWLFVAAALFLAVVGARRRARRLQLGNARAGFSGISGDALLLLALLAVGVALLGPRVGTRLERLSTSGVDVVVLVDVSRSMDARDLPPSRLDRARQAAAALLTGLEPGDRAALAAFAGRGVPLTPLTPDTAALVDLLPALDTDLVQPAASRLGEGVREALGLFDAASDRPRVLVVLSDGEDADATPDLGIADVRRAGVRVVSVGLGTEAGSTIQNLGLELRDRRGRIVTTRLDAARLAQLAEATDGAMLRPDAFGAVDPTALLSSVRRDAPKTGEGETVERAVPAVRVAPFALAALLLLILEAATRAGRSAPVLALTALAAFALGADGGAPRSDPRSLFARGLALAEHDRWADAERSFLAAALSAHDAELTADAYHDAGVAALRGGRLEVARDAFFESLAAAPNRETRFNLEWTLRALDTPDPLQPPPAGARPASDDAEEDLRPEASPDEPPMPRERSEAPRPTLRPTPRPLDGDEAQRWLERAKDDPTRALRGHKDEAPPSSRASAW